VNYSSQIWNEQEQLQWFKQKYDPRSFQDVSDIVYDEDKIRKRHRYVHRKIKRN
jgi:hypothetical protein